MNERKRERSADTTDIFRNEKLAITLAEKLVANADRAAARAEVAVARAVVEAARIEAAVIRAADEISFPACLVNVLQQRSCGIQPDMEQLFTRYDIHCERRGDLSACAELTHTEARQELEGAEADLEIAKTNLQNAEGRLAAAEAELILAEATLERAEADIEVAKNILPRPCARLSNSRNFLSAELLAWCKS